MDLTVDDYADVEATAERLDIHPESVRRLIRLGKLPAAKWGNKYIIRRDVLETYAKGYNGHAGQPSKWENLRRRKALAAALQAWRDASRRKSAP